MVFNKIRAHNYLIGRVEETSAADNPEIVICSGLIEKPGGASVARYAGQVVVRGIEELNFLRIGINNLPKSPLFEIKEFYSVTEIDHINEIINQKNYKKKSANNLSQVITRLSTYSRNKETEILVGGELFDKTERILENMGLYPEQTYQLYKSVNGYWDPEIMDVGSSIDEYLEGRFTLVSSDPEVQSRLSDDIVELAELADRDKNDPTLSAYFREEIEQLHQFDLDRMSSLYRIQDDLIRRNNIRIY